jgi:hypothetical protein
MRSSGAAGQNLDVHDVKQRDLAIHWRRDRARRQNQDMHPLSRGEARPTARRVEAFDATGYSIFQRQAGTGAHAMTRARISSVELDRN